MLHDLANDDSAVALKWAAKEKKDGDTEKGRQKPAVQQKTTTTEDLLLTYAAPPSGVHKMIFF